MYFYYSFPTGHLPSPGLTFTQPLQKNKKAVHWWLLSVYANSDSLGLQAPGTVMGADIIGRSGWILLHNAHLYNKELPEHKLVLQMTEIV